MIEIDSALKIVIACILSWTTVRLVQALFTRSTIRDLPGPARTSLITGNLTQLFSPDGISWHHEMAEKFGRVWKVNGWFGDEQVYVSDPKALHHIVVKDQDVFEETSMFISTNKLLFGNGLLSTLGDQHKKQRKLLNPVFSRAHMQDIIPIFNKITHKLRNTLSEKFDEDESPKEIDMMHWFSRAALEFVGQAGLGYSFDKLEGRDDNEYSKAAKGLFGSLIKVQIYRQFLPFFTRLASPHILSRIIDIVPFPAIKDLKQIVGVMHDTSVEVFEEKRSALERGETNVTLQVGEGKDIMSVLLRANSQASGEDRLPEAEILGQMNTLIFAAHDTTSSALSRILHMLAAHPHAQDRLRDEVTQAREQCGDLQYEELESLPYLDAVVRETLRLHAPVPFGLRTTRRDIVLPLGTPVISSNGQTITELHLKNNTNVILGHGVTNRDVKIWGEDAAEWNPERWIGKKPDEVAKEKLPGVYSGMMTFLGGGRACIGFKFSLMEIKVVLTILLESFRFELAEKEITWKSNLIFSPRVKGSDIPSLPLKVSRVVSSRITEKQ